MNNDSSLEKGEHEPLPPISAEEFDAKFDAGEDVSGYFDWNNAVVVEPGELTPGRKLSITKMMVDDLLQSSGVASSSLADKELLSVSVSPLVFVQIGHEAVRLRISREKLAESWIEQKLQEQKAGK